MYQIEQGQVYEQSRNNEIYKVVYVNEQVVLLQYGADNHRIEKREYFESCIDEGSFEPQQVLAEKKDISDSAETDQNGSEEIPFEDISWVGEKGAESLRDAGFREPDDIQRVSDERLLECDSVGETAVENIREWVKDNE